ncbi:anti-sigma B factor antagonist [Kitasatospora herbaricolor]|uniref:STAS domain-containing protein n=1 Tax=Kitasatospora herbaricolor TaxID=68217 RepID=UPI00278E5FF7|nr:STAS domain-containing protein [Kitasatospora herbaricolor]MDQ0305926.1 anti-sigma B factor antagonist [Kitasatospora herbaricolor]
MDNKRSTVAVVWARGDIDLETAPALHRRLEAALREHRDVVLDLSQVTFMDCAGLGTLLDARGQAERHGGRLVLRAVGPDVLRLLRLTGLEGRLTVTPDHHPADHHPPDGARPQAQRPGTTRFAMEGEAP